MQSEELAEHLFGSVLGALDVMTIHVGAAFGLYDALHAAPRTVAEVARATGMQPRYAQEWLEQQVVAGLVDCDDPALPAHQRRYSLSDEHAAVLSDPDSLLFLTPFASLLAAAAAKLPALLEAYRDGGGVGWAEFGPAMRRGQADANRPLYLGPLGSEWLPGIPGVHRALSAGGAVADIGCGDGWSSIGIALAYPDATVDGYDVDEASVRAARDNAAASGVADRVAFHLRDAAGAVDDGEGAGEGGYDLVAAFECVHDMPDPVSVLAAARRLAKPDGTVLVMDERVPERFTGPGDPVEQLCTASPCSCASPTASPTARARWAPAP